ncbi:phenylalanine--tRNA ligase subunit beta [Desulfovibrio sp. OttesenSCG-928-F20]|nr:phenylalanine--tRNA ligase subunit beta [Desulfovibrio sp. OttesenSCG-928-F20]
MLLSLNWLREFVPYEGNGAELGDRLTMAGLELDGLERPFEGLRPIVVGHVLECGKHPEADRLSVCKVDVGDEILDIVCGAPNVAKGQKVAVVKVGVTLPTGLTVKKSKLRGAPSHGMICSEFELGLSEEHDGILVLDAKAPVGGSLLDLLGLDDEVLDVAVTPNRGDCLSVLGLAREVAALARLPLSMPKFDLHFQGQDASSLLAIDIERPDLCPLYHGLIIEGAVSSKSPAWLRFRLLSVGVRAINNLVDATNYILMELGQPLHAFDLDALRGGRIIVRGADEGERFTTLDGQERILTAADITIRDAQGIIALGGVMGGLDSEITDKSQRVFLESAIFNPPSIRKTSRRLGLSSEASFRFERGVDQTGASFAMERAAHLMAELSGGFVRPGVLKNEARPYAAPSIRLRKVRAESLLGIALDDDFCAQTLNDLGCAVREQSQGEWEVTAPGWRRDLTREADLIEELVRIYGVDRVPPTLPAITQSLERAGMPESRHDFISRVKHWGRGAGLAEIITYSFVGSRELDALGLPEQGRIPIMNPLNDELNVLRPHLAPGLLNALRNNLSQGAASVRLFETASAFTADADSDTGAHENARLGLILYGTRHDRAWPHKAEDLDYLDLKGLVEHLLAFFALPAPDFVSRAEPLPWLEPCLEARINGKAIAFAGQVKADLADTFHARREVWTAEIDLDALYALHLENHIRFKNLPVFPPVRRDITFIADAALHAGSILQAIEAAKSPLLSEAGLIDCFAPQGKAERNLTFRLTFRHAQRTLKDAEADKQRDLIAAAVQKSLGVRL